MAEGRANTAIGRTLVLTQGAVEKHISSIFAKLGLPAVRRRPPAGHGRPHLAGGVSAPIAGGL